MKANNAHCMILEILEGIGTNRFHVQVYLYGTV